MLTWLQKSSLLICPWPWRSINDKKYMLHKHMSMKVQNTMK